jgi:predicted 3-demethylubiquinone-9 3-methyltransferase (glyoxalase superfamily)
MQRITPFLWFDHEAGQAAKLYVGIFLDIEALKRAYAGAQS